MSRRPLNRLALLLLSLALLSLVGACEESAPVNIPDDDDTSGDDDDDSSAADDDDSSGDDDDSSGDDDDSNGDDDTSDSPAVDSDGDGYPSDEDCNDLDAAVSPGATELCDYLDNDCDGLTDEPDADGAPTWYEDTDGDGYGEDSNSAVACNQPHGYSAHPGDCNDADPNYHPGAAETDCSDPADYNCDGSVGYMDIDNDGHAACEDCDDHNSTIHNAATEVCNQSDDDCDGAVDEAGATGETTWYLDADGDGYGRSNVSQLACSAPLAFSALSGDCDDLDASSYPGGTEICDGADNNCDSTADEGVTSTFYADADSDGYGNPASPIDACFLPGGASTNDLDCDDSHASVHPGGLEVCDSLDNDCDGPVDEDALDATTWYADSDADGYGAPLTGTNSCTTVAGAVANDGDCDDSNAALSPAATEVCNAADDNCNTVVDEGFDVDGDGITTCGIDGIAATADDDCDDTVTGSPLSGATAGCAATSCLAILNDGYSVGDGSYWIDPAGGNPLQVDCDMNTEGGGYTYYAISGGLVTSSYSDDNSCRALGMDIVYPRSAAHWTSMLARFATSYFGTVPGVYKTGGGGNYTGCAMNSTGCPDWRVGDGGRWWLRDSNYGEPNGDYSGYCWLLMYNWDVTDIQFNDANCSYSSSDYICSTNDKP